MIQEEVRVMDFSPEQRRKAAEQLACRNPRLSKAEVKGVAKAWIEDNARDTTLAINLRCQLNAAVELLRRLEKVTGYADITEFLAAFREEANDDQ